MQIKLFQKQMMKQIRHSLKPFIQGETIYMQLFNVEMHKGQ